MPQPTRLRVLLAAALGLAEGPFAHAAPPATAAPAQPVGELFGRCELGAGSWVRVVLPPRDDPAVDARGFVALLAVELGSRGFQLCAGEVRPETPAPVATIHLGARGEGVALTVEVRDAVTSKRVQRDIDVGGIPREGRALSLALAADELLRASWAELSLRGAPPPARPVPEEVRRTVADSFLARAPPRLSATLGGRVEWFPAGNLALAGAEVGASWLVDGRLGLDAHVGYRVAPRELRAAHGRVDAEAVTGAVGGSLRLGAGDDALSAALKLRLGVHALRFGGEAAPGAEGFRPAWQGATSVALGLSGARAVSEGATLGLDVLLGGVLRGVAALDGEARVAAARGAFLLLGLTASAAVL